MERRIRGDLRAMFRAAIEAVDGRAATRRALTALDLGDPARVWIIGAGKAAVGMARGAAEALELPIAGGLVIVNSWDGAPIDGIAVREARHPVPDQRGVDATRELLAMADGAGANDLVICLISGGGSALLVAPRPGISLTQLAETTDRLLRQGTPIAELNAVRRQLSTVKGGGLEDRIAPARLLSLAISDVPGDDPTTIASGPTRSAHIVANIGMALEAAAAASRRLGYRTTIDPTRLSGEAREVGALLASTNLEPGQCRIWGGETTVSVTGGGRGGRSQELALAAALILRDDRVLLAAGTDGIDGPTDAAGAIVDCETVSRSPGARAHLADNDAYSFLKATGDLLVTGPTGTNVADLVVLARPQ